MDLLYRRCFDLDGVELQRFYDELLPAILRASGAGLLPRVLKCAQDRGKWYVTVSVWVEKVPEERGDLVWGMGEIRGYVERVLEVAGGMWFPDVKYMRVVEGRMMFSRVGAEWWTDTDMCRGYATEGAVWKFYKTAVKMAVRKGICLREFGPELERQYKAFREVKESVAAFHFISRYCTYCDVTGGDLFEWYDMDWSERHNMCQEEVLVRSYRMMDVMWIARR
jgi:hypothetical protein